MLAWGVPTVGLPPVGGVNPEMATAVRPEPMALAYVPINVSDPPKYQSDRYELYRKEVLRWKDIHFGAHDSQLVGVMAIKGEGMIKSFLVQFMEETRNSPQTRTIARLLQKLYVELAKSAHETSMTKISIWSTFQRKANESIRQFWTRWEKLSTSLAKSGVVFPEQVGFYRALSAMKLPHPNLSILLGALESRSMENSIPELRRLSIKMFGAQFMEVSEEVLQMENEGVASAESNLDDTDGDGEIVDAFVGDDGEVYELRRAHQKKNNNKKARGFHP